MRKLLPTWVQDYLEVQQMFWSEKFGQVGTYKLFGMNMLVASLPFLSMYAFGNTINILESVQGTGELPPDLLVWVLVYAIGGVVSGVTYVLMNYDEVRMNHYLFRRVVMANTGYTSGADVESHEDPDTQDKFTTVTEMGSFRVPMFYQRMFQLAKAGTEILLATMVVLFWCFSLSQAWIMGMSLIALVVVTLLAYPVFRCEVRYGMRLFEVEKELAPERRRFWFARHNLISLDLLKEVKTYKGRDALLAILLQARIAIEKALVKLESSFISPRVLSILPFYSAIALSGVGLVFLVVQGSISLGVLTFLVVSLGLYSNAVGTFAKYLGNQFQDEHFVRAMIEVRDMKPRISSPAKPTAIGTETTPEIVFDNVWWQPEGAERPILRGVDLCIKPGEKIGLVGSIGAGKSTLVSMLLRHHDPTGGRILINGVDLRALDLDEWYERLGVLFQNYASYDGFQVKESIGMGRMSGDMKIDMDRVRWAAAQCGAEGVFDGWNLDGVSGYDRQIGRWFGSKEVPSVSPSGGESQSIALSRWSYRNPQVGILDEPTSSLDWRRELETYEALLAAAHEQQTLLFISHRYNTLLGVDRIVYLRDGQIVEEGSPAELLLHGGLFAGELAEQAASFQLQS